MKTKNKRKSLIKEASALLIFLALILAAYLFLFPFFPLVKYHVFPPAGKDSAEESQSLTQAKDRVSEFKNDLPVAEYAISPNRLIIGKIGVNAPIVEAKDEKTGLNKGAWRLPDSSTPDKGGNTVITGHRFKYLPPNNVTFYLFDKLSAGDIVSVIWENEDYYYRVKEVKIVPDTEMSILDPSNKAILTLFTCHPIYSTEKRLVVIAEPIVE